MSSVDTSILNKLNIKQLTEAVIETRGGTVDRSSPNRWRVDLPAELASHSDARAGPQETSTGNSALDSIAESIYGSDEPESDLDTTVVFDPQHEVSGEDDLVIQQGTPFFNDLLELAQGKTTVSAIKLGSKSLQTHEPPLTESLGAEARVGTFEQEQTAVAIAFHFHIQLEGTQSYHQEEFETITLDAQTGENIPELTERLLAHLGELSHEAVPGEFNEIDDEKAERLYMSATEIIKERLEPELEELQAEAADAADERKSEIHDLYDQRRQELDEQIKQKQEKIRELGRKAENARNNKTRQQYTRKQQHLREELEELQADIEARKEELHQEEQEQIASTTARLAVEADVTNIGTTIIHYDVGKLPVQIRDDDRIGETKIKYVPATDAFGEFECADCGITLRTDRPPVVCDAGHVLCSDCRQQCEQCGLIGCGHEGMATCAYCGTVECADCNEACATCGRTICDAHRGRLRQDGKTLCQICGGECTTCGDLFDANELTDCEVTADGYCLDHFGDCHCSERHSPEGCGLHCSDHIQECIDCGNPACDEHLEPCLVCDGGVCVTDRIHAANEEPLCRDHAGYCEQCEAHHIASDLLTCAIGGSSVCEEHAVRCDIGNDVVCEEHQVICETCDEIVCTDHAEMCDYCDQYHCENHSTACEICKQTVGVDHVESCTECGDTVCPADCHTCGTCNSTFCTPHTTPCNECGERFCYDHVGQCKTCKGWTCETHLSSCDVCNDTSCPSHTDPCLECGVTLCENHGEECKSCDSIYCPDDVTVCSVCREPVCPSHVIECDQCGVVLCSEHMVECSVCQTPLCPDHTLACADCDDVFCTDHVLHCSGCDNVICEADSVTCETCEEVFGEPHTESCVSCGGLFCASHRETCTTCDEPVCTEHAYECGFDGKLHCGHHLETCAVCVTDTGSKTTPYCEDHRITCSVGGEELCPEHANRDPILTKPVCRDHTEQCDFCERNYAPKALSDGRCQTCNSIGSSEITVPEFVAEDFRSVRGAKNEKYLIVYGKRLLSSNQLVVLERETNSELDRYKIGLIARLKEVFR